MWRVTLEAEAQADLRRAASWYGAQRAGLDQDFLSAVAKTLAGLMHSPLRCGVTALGLRRALVPRFPFAIYFRAVEPSIHVLAVLHQQRDVMQLLSARS